MAIFLRNTTLSRLQSMSNRGARATANHLLCRSVAFSSSTTSPTKKFNMVVVGTGRMGQIRLTGMQRDPRVVIAGIIDSATAIPIRHQLEEQYNTQFFSDIAEANEAFRQQNKTIDGLWIATPTPTHLQLIEDTLVSAQISQNLQAIGIEKPVGGTLEEIDAAYRLCGKHKVKLVCSFQRRFDPSYEALRRECVDQAAIGNLQSIHTVFRDHPCPSIEFLKLGGDPFHDLAVHDIDYVCTLVNEYPTRVYASGTSLAPELRAVNVMDKASVWLEFERTGVVCTMDLSRSAVYGYDQRIEVAGEFGMLQVQNPHKTTLVRALSNGLTSDTLKHSFPERFREAYLHEMDHFIDVIQGKAYPRVHWNAARMATIISEAARIAAIEKKVVEIKYKRTKQESPLEEPLVEYEYVY